MKLAQAVDGFSLYMTSRGRSQNTINLYLTYLHRLIEYLDNREIKLITDNDIQRFYAYMQTDYSPRRVSKSVDPLSKSTINKICVAIKSFYSWASPELHIPRADTKIFLVEDPEEEIIPFSEAEIKQLLAACQRTLCKSSSHQPEHYQRRRTRARDHAMILFLLDTGIRVSELCRLTISDVNMNTGDVRIIKFGSGRKTKGRTVYIENKSRHALWSYLASRNLDPRAPLFITDKTAKAMTRNGVRCLLEDMAKRARITKANPHRFRHTFAIQYLRNGGDVFTLQRLLGHASLKMVRRYLAIADIDTASAHKRASPVDNWNISLS